MSEPIDLKTDQLEKTDSTTAQLTKAEQTIGQPPNKDSKTKSFDSDSESSIPSCRSYEDDMLEEEITTVDTYDEGVFSDIVSTIRSLKVKIEEYKNAQQQAKREEAKLSKNKKGIVTKNSNTSTLKTEEADGSKGNIEEEKEDFDKTTAKGFLIDWYHTLVQLLNVLEKYKNDITKQNYLAVRKETHALSNTLLDDGDIACAYEIFYLYFDFFILQLVKNYSTLHIDMNEIVKMFYEKCILTNIISTLRKACSILFTSSFTTNDMQKLIDHNDILLLMINYVKEYHQSSIFPKRSRTSELFLDFIGSYCSKIELIPNVIKLGFLESVVRCIIIIRKSYRGRLNKKYESVRYRLSTIERLIVIVYNLCRHEDGIHAVNSFNVEPILEKIYIRSEDTMCFQDKLRKLLGMTLSLLSTPNQIRLTHKQRNKVLDDILEAIDSAADNEIYRSWLFHVSEPLVVLVKLMIYDHTLDYILQHAKLRHMKEATILKFLVNLFLRYHIEVEDDDPLKLITCTAMCNIFWYVSLRPQYKQELQKIEKFKTLIEQIANEHNNKKPTSDYQHYVPTYMHTIQKAVDGILCNILEQQQEPRDVYALIESVVSIKSASMRDIYPKSANDAQEINDSEHEETKLDDLINSDSAVTSDSSSSNSCMKSSDDDESNVSVTFDAGIFSNIVTKLRTLKEQATAPDRSIKSTLIEFQHIQVELVNLIERTKITNIMKKNYLVVEKVVKHSIKPLPECDLIKNFVDNYRNDGKEIFHLYFDFFKLRGIQKYLLHTKMHRALKTFYRNRVVNVVSVLNSVTLASSFTKQDLEELSNYNDILSLMLNYVETELESVTIKPTLNKITDEILGFIWNYADQTVLVPNLIKAGYPEAVLKWLSIIYGYGERRSHIKRTKSQKETAICPIINIIHNIARHDDGIQSLISCNALNLIKQFQNEIDSDNEMMVLTRMIIALISKPEEIQNDRKRINAVLDYMLQVVVDASKSKDFTSEEYHISEPLIVLVKLICYDRTLDYILQHADVDFGEEAEENKDGPTSEQSIVQFFINLFLKYHSTIQDDDPMKVTTCTALCNILWSVSLRIQYRKEFQKNDEFKKLINQIAHVTTNTTSAHYVPKYIENIQKAAEGILCNISNTLTEPQKLEKQSMTGIRALVLSMKPSLANTLTSLKSPKPSIMISYSHSDNDTCTQLYNELTKRQDDFDIWIDRKYCKTGYLWSKIADGMQEASIILCLLSNKYYESKSCQQEFVYAHDHLKKQVIPVFLRQGKPPGWIAIHTCILKYVRFKQTQPLEREKLTELMEMIDEYLSLNNRTDAANTQKSVISDTPPAHYEPTLSAITTIIQNKSVVQSKQEDIYTQQPLVNLNEKPVSEWSKEYVFQWFQQNEILPELYNLHPFKDGSELLNYASRILTDEKADAHYHNYSQAYIQTNDGKTLLIPQFLRFVDALRKLYYDSEPKSRMEVAQPVIQATSSNKPPTRNYSLNNSISKMYQSEV